MIRKTFALLLLAGMIAGCGGETKDVKAAILRYNQLLAECYRKMDMNPMQEAATLEHAQKLYYHMSALGEGRVRMISELKKVDYIEIRFPDKRTAAVRDREVWDFRHVDRETGAVILEEKDYRYELKYDLIKSGDRWIVKAVAAIGEEKPDPERKPQRHSRKRH